MIQIAANLVRNSKPPSHLRPAAGTFAGKKNLVARKVVIKVNIRKRSAQTHFPSGVIPIKGALGRAGTGLCVCVWIRREEGGGGGTGLLK